MLNSAAPPATSFNSWSVSPTPYLEVRESEGVPLAALERSELAGRYSHWLGASGRRYMFSVFDPASCPAYCDAILVTAKVDSLGRRTIVAIADTGDFPDPAVSRAAQAARSLGGRVELHLHLLAASRAQRREAIADLVCNGTPGRN